MERLLGGFPLEDRNWGFRLKRIMEGSVKNEGEGDQNPLEGPMRLFRGMVFAQRLERSRAFL